MAFEEKKFLSYEGLKSYNEKIQAKIDAADEVLDKAIQKVAGDLTAEVTNRENADKAINDKIGDTEGKTVVKLIEDAASAASTANENLAKRVAANEEAITTINDPTSGILKTAKGYADAEIAKEKSRAEAAEQQNANDIDALEGRATTLETNVNTLIGTDANKSVRTIANEELAAQLLSGDAEADFKTLQELAAWLEDHPEDVAAINLAIDNLEKLVGKLPEDITATTVVGYVQELVAAEAARADAAEKANAKDIADLRAAIGEGGAVAEQIDAKIQALDADVSSAEPEAGKGVKVQVVETDGKITAVNVTGNYDNAYEAKGAAETLAQGAVKDNADAIAEINDENTCILATANKNIDNLEKSFVEISTTDIDILFPTV